MSAARPRGVLPRYAAPLCGALLCALLMLAALHAPPAAAQQAAAGAAAPLSTPGSSESPWLTTDRFRHLASELRCLVCQNQNLWDSHAPLAQDLRNQVLEQMETGKSDAEIKSYLVDRYGEFVLYRPSFTGHNLLLWLGPFVLLAGGGLIWSRLGGRDGSRAVPAAAGTPLPRPAGTPDGAPEGAPVAGTAPAAEGVDATANRLSAEAQLREIDALLNDPSPTRPGGPGA